MTQGSIRHTIRARRCWTGLCIRPPRGAVGRRKNGTYCPKLREPHSCSSRRLNLLRRGRSRSLWRWTGRTQPRPHGRRTGSRARPRSRSPNPRLDGRAGGGVELRGTRAVIGARAALVQLEDAAGNQLLVRLAKATSESITGTSMSTPTTVASARARAAEGHARRAP